MGIGIGIAALGKVRAHINRSGGSIPVIGHRECAVLIPCDQPFGKVSRIRHIIQGITFAVDEMNGHLIADFSAKLV